MAQVTRSQVFCGFVSPRKLSFQFQIRLREQTNGSTNLSVLSTPSFRKELCRAATQLMGLKLTNRRQGLKQRLLASQHPCAVTSTPLIVIKIKQDR